MNKGVVLGDYGFYSYYLIVICIWSGVIGLVENDDIL